MTLHAIRLLAIAAVATAVGACQGGAAGDMNSGDNAWTVGHAAHGDHAMAASAREFDKQFLDEMSQHHAGAIAMAQVAQQLGFTDHMKSMANTLVSKQQGELQQMQSWRTQWYGHPRPWRSPHVRPPDP
jgi:uncharacterized protein (DUF305 family)